MTTLSGKIALVTGASRGIAGATTFLASDEARWISGDIIRVDGGSKL